jgi:drug/metabolite transporter (DMT)-like permease
MFYFTILGVVLGNVMYHVAQKSVPTGIHPVVSILVNYLTATVISLALFPFYPDKASIAESLRALNWAPFGVGVAIVLVELFVLLAYRAGWKLSLASGTISATTAVVLAVLGFAFLGEQITSRNAAGIVLCVVGVLLMVR